MKNLSWLILIIVLMISISCDDKNDLTPQMPCIECLFDCFDDTSEHFTNDCPDNYDCEFSFFENALIVHENNAQITSGTNIVFKVNLYNPGNLGLADDEITDTVLFEIDRNATSFIAENIDFEILNVKHQRGCFCVDVEFRQVKNGCIQGEMLMNGQWRVQGHLEIVEPIELTLDFDATFSS